MPPLEIHSPVYDFFPTIDSLDSLGRPIHTFSICKAYRIRTQHYNCYGSVFNYVHVIMFHQEHIIQLEAGRIMNFTVKSSE